jgi:hypothetical protein
MRRYQRWGAAAAPLLLALVCLSRPLHPQVAAPDTTPLTFNEIPAGTSLAQLSEQLRSLKGTPLRCLRSSRDQSVQECRASFSPPGIEGIVEVWLSAIDSLSGILTLKYSGSSATLERWRDDLELRYGSVPTQIQGTQRMKQWVRRGRMIRLTWRREADGTSVSVSLVDGRVLDGWGARPKNSER